jgi:hypothetical protein
LDDIWKSAEYVNIDPAANKNGGHDGDEGEYEDQDDDKDEDEIQDDDKGEDDEDYNEIEDESQKRVVVDTSDPSDDEATSTWSSDSQEDHPQDPALDILPTLLQESGVLPYGAQRCAPSLGTTRLDWQPTTSFMSYASSPILFPDSSSSTMRYPSTDKTPLPIGKKKVSPYKVHFFNLMRKT